MSGRVIVAGLVIVFLALVSGTAWFMLSRGLSADLSVIGQGRPVAVLVYENHSPTSMQAFDRLTTVRDAFAGRLEFRMAAGGTPRGDAFIERHRVAQGALVLFDARGGVIGVMPVSGDRQGLVAFLEQAAGE